MLILYEGAVLFLDGVRNDGAVMEVAPPPFAETFLMKSVADGLLLAVDGDFGALLEGLWREDVSVLLASWQTPARVGIGGSRFDPLVILLATFVGGSTVVITRWTVVVGG